MAATLEYSDDGYLIVSKAGPKDRAPLLPPSTKSVHDRTKHVKEFCSYYICSCGEFWAKKYESKVPGECACMKCGELVCQVYKGPLIVNRYHCNWCKNTWSSRRFSKFVSQCIQCNKEEGANWWTPCTQTAFTDNELNMAWELSMIMHTRKKNMYTQKGGVIPRYTKLVEKLF